MLSKLLCQCSRPGADYLDAKYPQPALQPADPAAAAKARLFAEVFSSSFTPAMFAVIRTTNRAELAEARDKLVAALKASRRGGEETCVQVAQLAGRRRGAAAC